MNIVELKAWELKEKLFKGELSSREIVQAHLDRIDKLEENLNAFISYDSSMALEKADEIDKKIKNKEKLGSLAGLPIGVKDNILTKDLKTTAGSRMLENFESPYDATVVNRIKSNDGIILGKTNLDEFAAGATGETSYFGSVKNPLDNSKLAGGSSSGSAAAVASGEVALSLGSDTGGSIGQPAGYCGLVGIKPSYGSVSRYGLISLSNSLDQVGVFGKDVRDAALILNSITGYDELDVTSVDINSVASQELEAIDSLKGMKIALPKEIFQSEMDPKVRAEMEKSIGILTQAGAMVEKLSITHLEYAPEVYRTILYSDASSNMARFDGIRYGYRAKDYHSLDELYIRSRTEPLGEEIKKIILTGTYLLSNHRGETYYKQAQKIRSLMIEQFNNVFSNYDFILAPSSPNLAMDIGGTNKSLYRNYNGFVNLAGLCSITLPTSKDNSLGIGLQIIGDRFKDHKIISLALAYEGMVK